MFLLIWQGLGAYALVIPFFLIVITYLPITILLGVDTATRFGTALFGFALLGSGLLLRWLVARLAARPVRHLLDQDTGEEITLEQRHTMFFVPLRYWAVLYLVVGGVMVIAGLLQGTVAYRPAS